MPALYTVYRCQSQSSDVRKGYTHYSHDGEVTLCGKEISDGWFIFNNTFDGNATCPKCRRLDLNPINPDTSVAYWKARYLDLLKLCKDLVAEAELVNDDAYKIMLPYRFMHSVEASEKMLLPNDWRHNVCDMMSGKGGQHDE